MRHLALLLPIAAIACAPTERSRAAAATAADAAQAGLARELAGLTPGPALTCLPTFARTDLRGYGSTLVYVVSKSLKYRTETNGGCDGVGRRDDILVTRSPQGRVCAGDIAQTLDRASRFPNGGCALGQFVPYRKP